MPAQPVRYGRPDPADPVVHEIPPLQWQGEPISVRAEIRRDADGMWRGRLLFGPDDALRVTAEILCAVSEQELWLAVSRLSTDHLRDLYRSMVE